MNDTDNSFISDDVVKELIVESISLRLFEKIVDTFTVEEFTSDLEGFTQEKISIMIDKKYFNFTHERLKELITVCPDLVEKFIVANLEEFFEIADEVCLPYGIIVSLINNDVIENENKSILFSMIRAEDIDEDAVDILLDMKLNVDKAYIEKAWEISEKDKKIDLLSQYIHKYNMDEISKKLLDLGGIYSDFSDRSKRHRVKLKNTKRNYMLLKCLKEKGYLTSIIPDNEPSEDYRYISGMVKKQ